MPYLDYYQSWLGYEVVFDWSIRCLPGARQVNSIVELNR
jgi:hypothetical protein